MFAGFETICYTAVFDYYKGFVHSRQLRIPPMESSVTVLMLDAMPLAWC